jgi:hypothetical protein
LTIHYFEMMKVMWSRLGGFLLDKCMQSTSLDFRWASNCSWFFAYYSY